MKYRLRSLTLLPLLAIVTGCASPGYYLHAVSGQFEILNKRRPVEEVLSDPATTPRIRRQLELVRRLRDFASRELGLPDNRSYRTYADLERPFVVWNAFATPELSLEPKQWCFLFAGCVSYRGYFARVKAEKFAADLKQDGYDVYVGGAPAYSTLGWFNDPLLNTFIHRAEADLAGLLFHELAHQVLYVSGDTAFNESFATVVELEGVKRWFERHGTAQQARAYRQKIQRREQFILLVRKHKTRLAEIYASNLNDAEKRSAKIRVFEELRSDYEILKASWGNYADYDKWISQDLNNAHLAAIGMYSQHVAAFQKLLAQQGDNLMAFYHSVKKMANLPENERRIALQNS
ncbi:MAG: aminopeptidase [Candidatus Muproteobacteria bacterium RIFCSPHIGHO2_12_FULL_60_33]|uniref:Aminopeptidase n=1 Tax=Candidatus Muproteobacteria bacterium RIFCSPLOWO2_01_FULL_60_18 TaxID=1817768 RepID=A0A1F6TXK2_9PROT|nr:MAG: aminopeptidase [Candidatus Muproteobacteria bacterium RIFCSPHIGHO2_01_60_12]OGI49853.1 MAG: aminopeptidase [Candidatus Muproteobacteria bacterium RIFCSPLOWO2_01_FULL_60_18]OGI53648.1 MAG: aminopeptidase [Candidatus Muproteobacteria bacterium RIFCSPHIGHO2_12_FULL_60_33]OGI55226.1 MAG: aminopeptidase [Candidatus Muproteobacteria bacterium RIFCSPHIGHO2_02_FULL_60_13]